jgi:Ca2+-binding RTX toxin-like protein
MGRLALITALLVAGCAFLPGGAAAGTAKLVHHPSDGRTNPSEEFSYNAGAGEVNRLSISTDTRGDVLVSDAAGVTLGRGCARVVLTDPTRARCHAPGGEDIDGISAELGDRDDRSQVGGYFAAAQFVGTVDGGPGNDVMTGGDLRGGSGNDTLHSSSVMGGPGSDTLTTPNVTGTGPGGSIDESDPGNGSDVIRGGSGSDVVRYSRRRGPVTVDLRAASGAGESGENDRITGVEGAEGGRGNDTLIGTDVRNDLSGGGGSDRIVGGRGDDWLFAEDIANSGSGRDRDRIDAGPGDDEIGGSAGPNVIRAGPGEDRVSGEGGNDRIGVRDRSIDRVVCGPGRRDLAIGDGLDFLPGSCERVRRRGRARAVPVFVSVNSQSDEGPAVSVGCSIDGPKVWRGTVSISGPGLRGTRRFRSRRGREAYVLFPARLRLLEGKRVRIVVSSLDRRGNRHRVTRQMLVDTEG